MEDLVAEALAVDSNDVYAATVSKAGNVSVRSEQSGDALAPVVVSMCTYDDPQQLERTVAAAERRFLVQRKEFWFVFARNTTGAWTLQALLVRRGTNVPAVVTGAWPSAAIQIL